MIPRTLHTIWVGSSLPDRLKPIVATWRALHPDWTFTHWGDDDLDWLENRDLYDRAEELVPEDGVGQFRANLARYEILHRYGGVYVDTDLAALKPIDPLLDVEAFAGWEVQDRWIGNTILGSVPGHPFFRRAIDGCAASIAAHRPRTRSNRTTGPRYITRLHAEDAGGLTVYPQRHFYPYGHEESWKPRGTPDYTGCFTAHHWWHQRTIRGAPLQEGVVGKVESGSGRASTLMADCDADLWDALGYEPASGTLNINVGRSARAEVKEWPAVKVPMPWGFPNYRPAMANGHPVHVRLSRSSRTVELVAAERLRDALGLIDGDRVEVVPR